ncbi:MAG: hypothetical protein KIT31_43560, partial [Deltaproteobacteria bacterium]|nr:hypothetical protein [Deltaproteobacteria bacterium]
DLRTRADTLCPLATCSDPAALRLNRDARAAATRANWSYAAGGAAALTAVVLWYAGAPRRLVITPDVTRDTTGAVLAGTF